MGRVPRRTVRSGSANSAPAAPNSLLFDFSDSIRGCARRIRVRPLPATAEGCDGLSSHFTRHAQPCRYALDPGPSLVQNLGLFRKQQILH